MRWNCPHCEELVTAGIDFESTTKAYVRCARCNGMALIHRSAVLADYVKARRMDEEAQLESELRLQQQMKQSQALQQSIHAQNLQVQALQSQIQQAAREIETARTSQTMASAVANLPILEASTDAPPPARAPTEVNVDGRILRAVPPPMRAPAPAATLSASAAESLAATVPSSLAAPASPMLATPPPFVQATIRLQDEAPAPEAPRAIPVPPAFLVGSVEDAVRAFAIEETQESEDIFFVDTANPARTETKATDASRLRSNLAVWIAAALALASGIYLYHEGKQALAPSVEVRAEP